MAKPGDTILVGDGLYQHFAIRDLHGSKDRPVVIFATGDGAKVAGIERCDRRDEQCRDGILLDSSSHIVIDGLQVAGATRAGIALLYSHDITVRNVRTGPNGRWGIFSGFSDRSIVENNEAFGSREEHGIYLSNSSDDMKIVNNWVHDNSGCGIQINADYNYKPEEGKPYFGPADGLSSGAEIRGNLIHDNGVFGGAAINLDGVIDSVVADNVIYGNLARGIVNYGDRDGVEDDDDGDGWGREGPRGMIVENNWVEMPVGARHGVLFRFSTGPNTLRNNVLIHRDPRRAGLELATQRDENYLQSDNNKIDRIAIESEEHRWGTTLSLAQWQDRSGRDASSSEVPSCPH